MKNANGFLQAIGERRSLYAISSEKVVSEERVQEIVEFAVKHTPSAFNSQSARVIVLFGEQSNKLWKITTETLRNVVPSENFASTQEKMDMFSAGYGTLLFFEDQAVIEGLQSQFDLYADKFPVWSNEASGMLQLVIWTALEAEGLGATLQHYNPLIDDEVKATWNIPTEWRLTAQMPFGKPIAPAGEKQFNPIAERVKVYK